jgi:hypothetical protein
MSWPDFWLQPARDAQTALRQAVRAVALEMGSPGAPPSLATVEARADGAWLVRVVMGERPFVVLVAEEGAHAEILAARTAESAIAA